MAGRPGLSSARFAGEGAGDKMNNEKLLHELAGVPAPAAGVAVARFPVDAGGAIITTTDQMDKTTL